MTLPRPFEARPEVQPLLPLVHAARNRDIGVFQLGSVVRRTEPHVRYLLFDIVRGSCLSSFFCVTAATPSAEVQPQGEFGGKLNPRQFEPNS